MANKKIIAVLGGGFGGLAAAMKLSKELKTRRLIDKYEIFLIDQNSHHTFYPLLYEVATTSKQTANLHSLHDLVAYNFEEITKKPIIFIRGKVSKIDFKDNLIFSEAGIIPFDYLILALGAETNYFDIPGLQKYSLPFKKFEDAIKIRDAVWNLAMEGKEEIRILIGGGGASGIELAGELREWSSELKEEFRVINLKVNIIEAADTILPGYPFKVIHSAIQRLKKLSVAINTGKIIKKVEEGKIFLTSGETFPFDILIWTGGVRAANLISTLSLFKTEKKGRLEIKKTLECQMVKPDLQVKSKVYALGDNTCFYDQNGRPIAGIVPYAIAQGKIAALNVIGDIAFEEKKSKVIRHFIFRPKKYPSVTPLGGKCALISYPPFIIKGRLAWLLKGLIEFRYLKSIMPFFKALQIWIYGIIVFGKNDRLG